MKVNTQISVGLLFLLKVVLAARNYGVDPATELDLTSALSLNIDDIQGVTQVPGMHNNAPAFLFDGTSRSVMLDDSYMMKMVNMLSTATEFTMMVSILQDKKNSGSVICMSKDHNRYMDLFISTRNDQIKFYYTHNGAVRSESFNVHLAQNEWHQVAITVSGQQVTLHLDCQEAITVRIPQPDLTFSRQDLDLWLGQRGPQKALYKGYLQDARIIAGSHGFVAQCPSATRECPTCGEYMGLVGLVDTLEKKVQAMEFQLTRALDRLDQVESCECVKECDHRGQSHAHGDAWMEGCTSCSCMGGDVVCAPAICEPVYCKNPVYQEGQCCPSCLRNCTGSGGYVIHHDEYYYQKLRSTACSKYQCQDGTKRHLANLPLTQVCTTLTCPTSERFNIAGSCCQFCNGHDFCNADNLCTAPKICLSHATYHECVCPGGFREVGDTCVDIDECSEGYRDVMHCQEGTVCVNIQGSYRCNCLPGYMRASDTHCTRVDECSEGGHNCSSDATCVDVVEGFLCVCNDGFLGDGETCISECSPPCQNGGQCELSGVCRCPRGFKGKQCQNDVDECERQIDDCTGVSHCVNLVGSFHCECNTGYRKTGSINDNGDSCADIDECEDGHTCHKERLCLNQEGSYECRCSPGGNCDPHCWITKKKNKKHGSEWTDGCQTCTCEQGVSSCTDKVCDCSADNVNLDCCPQCELSVQCMHQSTGVIYEDRESWVYECQVCRCVSGFVECSPMECPTPNCRDTYTPVGECCPHCQMHPSCDAVINSPQSIAQQTMCISNGVSYYSNQRWLMDEDFCTECICMGGNICCHYNSLCESEL